MKTIDVILHGTAPLLMNSNRGVNPLEPLSKELKAYTSKRKKTDEDYEMIYKIKWLLALYYEEGVGPVIPAECVEACFREGAKKSKKGKDFVMACRVDPDRIPLDYDGPKDIEKLQGDIKYCDFRVGRIQRASINICRPRFNHWSIKFKLSFDETIFDIEDLKTVIDTAGKYIGLCDYRPRYGTFTAMIV